MNTPSAPPPPPHWLCFILHCHTLLSPAVYLIFRDKGEIRAAKAAGAVSRSAPLNAQSGRTGNLCLFVAERRKREPSAELCVTPGCT